MTAPKNINKSILVLPSWYPGKINAFSGDFIQRHVKAISLYNKQYVIYVVKDDNGIVTSDITVEENIHDNYTEQIIYYKPIKTGISLLDKLLSQQKYKRVYRKAITDYIHLNGCTKMIHVHVAFKAGTLALWAKQQWGIPYIVTEHWTVYLKEADLRYEQFSFIHRKLIKKIVEQASAVTAVSDWLGKAIQHRFPSVNYKVIPNVVDKKIFFPVEKIPNNTIQLIHASTMNYQKNIEAIISACSILKKRKIDFVLKLFGPVPPSVIVLVEKLNLQAFILFKG
ncbi:MAG TPA: glycosyltransferase, partial [Ferruginibacter sp.]|nr:glycosyltransferase [Ferruginibacter sp.]